MINKYLISILIALSLLSPAYAFKMYTDIIDAPNPATFVAYFNNNDSVVVIETSNPSWTGYSLGLCRVNSDQINGQNNIIINEQSSYDIWAADSNNTAGHVQMSPIGEPDSLKHNTTQDITLNQEITTPSLNAISAPAMVNLVWSQVTNATGYKIYRRDPSMATGIYSLIKEITNGITTSYSDDKNLILGANGNVDQNVVYEYFIIAIGKDEQGAEIRSGHSKIAFVSPTESKPVIITDLKIYASATEVKAGQTINLSAEVVKNNGQTETVPVTWTITGSDKYDLINNTFTPKESVPYMINAKYGVMPSNSINIQVYSEKLDTYTLSADQTTVKAGQIVTLSATDGKDIHGNKVLIVKYEPATWFNTVPDTYTITVNADGVENTIDIKVEPDVTTDITVSPASALVELGDTLDITAKGIDKFGNETGTASTSYPANKLGDNAVTMTIGTKSKDAIVKVIPKVTSISIDQNNSKIEKEEDLILTVSGIDSTNNKADLTADCVFENADKGVFTVKGKEDGVHTVKATRQTLFNTLTAEAIINLNINAPVITVKNNLNETIVNGAILPSLPKLSISVEDASGINTDVKIFIDGIQVKASEIQTSNASVSGVKSYTVAYAAAEKLSVGTHTLKITAQDILGKPAELTISDLKVYAGVSVIGTPLNYPNPVKPLTDLKTTIKYTLANDADVKIIILDVTGKQVFTKFCASGTEGGQINSSVEYDCKDTSGNVLGNGVYHYLLINEGQVIGRGQIAVLD